MIRLMEYKICLGGTVSRCKMKVQARMERKKEAELVANNPDSGKAVSSNPCPASSKRG